MLITNTTYANTYGTIKSEKKTEVSPNVYHIQRTYLNNNSPQSVNILDVNLVNNFTNIEIGLPKSLNTLSRTSLTAANNSYEGHRVVGAVNAAYFNVNTGSPSNLLAIKNEIVNYGILGTKMESPTQNPVAFGVSEDGKGIADYYTPTMTYEINGKKLAIDLIDQTRAAGKTVLYSSANVKTGTNIWGMEIVVENASKSTKSFNFGDEITGTVKKISRYQTEGNNNIPANGFVISTSDKAIADSLSNVKVGDDVKVNISIDQKWQDAQFILAGGPLLVKDGKRNISMPTNTSFVTGTNPRTAIAVDATGKRVFFVTVDGRQRGYSVGTSLTKLADYLISIGAKYAINLDGGGSTTMAVRQLGTNTPVVVNKPSDGSERRVSAVLQVINSASAGLTRTITLNSTPKELYVGDSLTVSVKNAYDEYLNPKAVSADKITWRVEGDIGKMNGSKFTATKGGKAKIIGTYENAKVQFEVTVLDPLAISSFDNASLWSVTSDRATASIAQNKTYARQGSASVALTYNFLKGQQGTKTANVIAKQPISLYSKPNHIGVWVYGDGNKNWLRGKIIDGAGKTYTIDFTAQSKMNWTGWKYVTAKIPQDITTPIKFERLYIASSVASEWAKGTVYFDQLQAVYDSTHTELTYTDVGKTFWAYSSINKLNELKLIIGYANGTYQPNKPITRAEVATILTRHLKLKATKETKFSDVSKSFYAYDAIQAIAQKGIITGRQAGKFAPNGQLTRAEMTVIIQRMLNLKGQGTLQFKDVAPTHWAYSSIQAIVANKLASGYPDATFRPDNSISRAEFAKILSESIQ